MEKKSEIKTPTNEEVIDELTKDLKDSCIRDSSKGLSEENENKCAVSDDPWDNIGKELGDEAQDDSKACLTELPEDFVDEEALKDREVNLNEDDAKKMRIDAEALKNEGNTKFKNGEYKEAVIIYTRGIQTCPLTFDKDRAILYANRAAAKSKYMVDKDSAIADCTKAIELNPNYVKAYSRRARLYEESDKLDEALADYNKVLTFDPTDSDANYAIRRLPPLIQEKNEKLKTEMLGKLKELGNMVLRPFGLSTENFELQKDPNSGGYSVKFNQNSS
ncbi:tetratricopeptide repeat protein 1 [Cephus cinctus]|uniref:Tetratricopeptide repeat protein 1 n=1 Tax=Cephus cinctus TaxID=211228 RepID=A0AAJ7FJH7_CEPCN|nr:tetratricopeptide repeat protein 1 [Cephus cinctus]